MRNDDLYTLYIPADQEEIHKILQNWARWCKVSWSPSSVKSLEGRYRPPPMYHEPVPSNPPNILQAHYIEHLVVIAPKHYGDHLRYWYIKKLPPKVIIKKLEVPKCDLLRHLNAARDYVRRHVKIT